MKKFFGLVLTVIVLAGCAPVAQSMAVQLPDELVTLIGFGVMVGVTTLFKWLSSKLNGVDLSGQVAVITSAISTLIVIAINYGLQLVPAAYDNILSSIFAFLIVFLGGAGVYSLFFRRKNPELPSAKKAKK